MRIFNTFLFSLCLLLSIEVFSASNSNFEEKIVDAGYARFSTHIWSEGEAELGTIFALPGSGADASRYQLVGPLLADAGYKVIGINQRGIMGSTGSLDNLSLRDLAADVIAIADELEIEKFHLAGWAFGNRTSRMLATIYPDRLASLTLIAAGGLVPAKTEAGELAQLLDNSKLSINEKVHLAHRTMFSPDTEEAIVRSYVEKLTYWPDARIAQRQANQNTDLEEWANGGSGPILMVMGVDDLTAPIDNGHLMKERLGERLTLVAVDGAGHAIGLEKPKVVAAAIIQFLVKHAI